MIVMASNNSYLKYWYFLVFVLSMLTQFITNSDGFKWTYKSESVTSCQNTIRWQYDFSNTENFTSSTITFSSGKVIGLRKRNDASYTLQSGFTTKEYLLSGGKNVKLIVKSSSAQYDGKYCCSVEYTDKNLTFNATSCSRYSAGEACIKSTSPKRQVKNDYVLFFLGLCLGFILLVVTVVVIAVNQLNSRQEDLPALQKSSQAADSAHAHDGPASSSSHVIEIIPIQKAPDKPKTSVSGSTDHSPNAHDGPASTAGETHQEDGRNNKSATPKSPAILNHPLQTTTESKPSEDGDADLPNAYDGPASTLHDDQTKKGISQSDRCSSEATTAALIKDSDEISADDCQTSSL